MDVKRLEAFSDAVLAIIITITVVGIHIPEDASVFGILAVLPMLLIYAWSFQTIGTFWNNHHHLLRATRSMNNSVMWVNLSLLFWLSLIPFTTLWLGEHIGETWPTAVYCGTLLFASIAYVFLERTIVAHQGKDSLLAQALSNDTKDKISLILYVAAVASAFFMPYLSYMFVVAVAIIWFIPDRRIQGTRKVKHT